MAIQHPSPGQIIDVLGTDHRGRPESETLIRTTHLEVFRYVLPAGKVVNHHAAAGVMVLQCLEGAIDFTALGRTQRIDAGRMLWLGEREPHSLAALSESLLLITILLDRA